MDTDTLAYYDDTSVLSRQAIAAVLRLWRSLDPKDISRSWEELLPEANAILIAAETVGAELADPYLTQVLDDADTVHPAVDVGGMIGPVESLLYLPVIEAKTSIRDGMAQNLALLNASKTLSTYVHTATADTARLAVTSGMTARRHASGYYRFLRPPSCKRCAILAGRFYRWNKGFPRHFLCDCGHRPVREADSSLAFDAVKSIRAGQVTGLSKADTKAILEFGANPSQVVNASAGMYDVGQFSYTATGTSRGIAAARITAKSVDRALGVDVSRQTYTNYSFDRYKVAEFAELFRRGKTYARTTSTGRTQEYAYRFTRTPRPTAQQIVSSTDSRDEAIRLLTNYGYVI